MMVLYNSDRWQTIRRLERSRKPAIGRLRTNDTSKRDGDCCFYRVSRTYECSTRKLQADDWEDPIQDSKESLGDVFGLQSSAQPANHATQLAQLRKLQPCLSNSYGLAHREKLNKNVHRAFKRARLTLLDSDIKKNLNITAVQSTCFSGNTLIFSTICSWMRGTETFTISSTVRCWMRF